MNFLTSQQREQLKLQHRRERTKAVLLYTGPKDLTQAIQPRTNLTDCKLELKNAW